MDRTRRARNLLTELEALQERNADDSIIGLQYLLEITLKDAEALARELLATENLKEQFEMRKAAKQRLQAIDEQIALFEEWEAAA